MEDEIREERTRLRKMGADFESTQRGGQLTYHGPGQIVGYPLLDLGRTTPAVSIRDYICRIQTTLRSHLRDTHGIESSPSEHTGVFLDAHTKVASIGVQVRHRLTTHGFAFNVTREPLAWFDTVVACVLADVRAGSIAGRSVKKAEEEVTVAGEIPALVETFGRVFGREMVELEVEKGDEVNDAILELEGLARDMERSVPVSFAPLLDSSLMAVRLS